jgi:hypothetical protein
VSWLILSDLSELVRDNPTLTSYAFPIDVGDDLLSCFASLLCGDEIRIVKSEVRMLRFIAGSLQTAFGHFRDNESRLRKPKVATLCVVAHSVREWTQRLQRSCTVTTDCNIYHFNAMQAAISGVLQEYTFETPFVYRYHDGNGIFGVVAAFMSRQAILIDQNNAGDIAKIGRDLRIDELVDLAENFLLSFRTNQGKLAERESNWDATIGLQRQLFGSGFIDRNYWLESEERICEFVTQIMLVARTRVEKVDGLAELAKSLKNEMFLDILRLRLLADVTNDHSKFIWRLFQLDLIPLNFIELFMKGDLPKYTVWFLPELRIASSPFPEEVRKLTRDWDLYRRERELQQNPNPLAAAIRANDVDALHELIASGGFNVNFVIPNWPFENTEPMSLLGYAASHNSLRCVRYLIMNHATFTLDNFAAAIRSGNSEIIRLFDEKRDLVKIRDDRFDRAGSLMAMLLCESIVSHRMDVFRWILESETTSKELLIWELSDFLRKIFASSNFDAFLTLVDCGVHLDAPVSVSGLELVRSGSLDMFRLLDTFARKMLLAIVSPERELLDSVASGADPSSIICHAARTGNFELVKFMRERLGRRDDVEFAVAGAADLSCGFKMTARRIWDEVDQATIRTGMYRILLEVCDSVFDCWEEVSLFIDVVQDLVPAVERAVECGNYGLALKLLEIEVTKDRTLQVGRIFLRSLLAGGS